jgi:large subunit ribosomal protein L24
MKIRKGDTVIVISGKDKGKTGEVTRVFPKKDRVLVQGINVFKRHLKSRDGVEGGIYPVERPMDVSKVMMLDPKTQKPTRVTYKVSSEGKKVRIAVKSGNELTTDKKVKSEKPAKKSKSTKKED